LVVVAVVDGVDVGVGAGAGAGAFTVIEPDPFGH